ASSAADLAARLLSLIRVATSADLAPFANAAAMRSSRLGGRRSGAVIGSGTPGVLKPLVAPLPRLRPNALGVGAVLGFERCDGLAPGGVALLVVSVRVLLHVFVVGRAVGVLLRHRQLRDVVGQVWRRHALGVIAHGRAPRVC